MSADFLNGFFFFQLYQALADSFAGHAVVAGAAE